MNATLNQSLLMVSACGAVMLLSSKNPRTRAWGCVIGFCGQPLWFITAQKNGQWGIIFMCFWYAAWYARGFFVNRNQIL